MFAYRAVVLLSTTIQISAVRGRRGFRDTSDASAKMPRNGSRESVGSGLTRAQSSLWRAAVLSFAMLIGTATETMLSAAETPILELPTPPQRRIWNVPPPGYSTSKEPTEVHVGGRKFIIPRNYFFMHAGGKAQPGGITLHALLPALEALAQEDLINDVKRGKTDDFVLLGLNARFEIPLERIAGGIFVDPNAKREPFLFDLLRYEDPFGFERDIFAASAAPHGFYWISCANKQVGGLPLCRRDIQYSERVVIHYRFSRSHLEKWREIEERVYALFADFDKGETTR